MYTYIIKQDGIEKKKFTDQGNDQNPFGWLLRNQGQSVNYALKYGGWSVTEIDQETGKETIWKPYN